MTPEQKFKEWALDPNGGGWDCIPKISEGMRLLWGCQQRAFLAGMEVDRWISVEERLPDNSNMCLISDGEVYVDVAAFSFGKFIAPEDWEVSDIKFWQPLPKPPKP